MCIEPKLLFHFLFRLLNIISIQNKMLLRHIFLFSLRGSIYFNCYKIKLTMTNIYILKLILFINDLVYTKRRVLNTISLVKIDLQWETHHQVLRL